MKRAIAMKCNQENWDAIKDKLVGCDTLVSRDFETHMLLTNNWNDDFKCIANHDRCHSNMDECEIHETWNEQVFLEACGIETEKIFYGSELQFWTGYKWGNCYEFNKYRLRPDYSAEIAELERQIQILKNK